MNKRNDEILTSELREIDRLDQLVDSVFNLNDTKQFNDQSIDIVKKKAVEFEKEQQRYDPSIFVNIDPIFNREETFADL